MDDTRVEWMRNKVYDGLRLVNEDIFENCLSRENGANESILTEFLNTSSIEGKSVVFFVTEVAEEEQIEVEQGEGRL